MAAYRHFEPRLIVPLVFVLLIPDVRSNHVLAQPYRGNEVPPDPEVPAGEVLLERSKLSCRAD